MGWRLPWARRLQSPCRTGEPSLAAHSTAPTRPYELAGIARKPCARWQRRSSASGALLVAAAEGLEIQHLLGPHAADCRYIAAPVAQQRWRLASCQDW